MEIQNDKDDLTLKDLNQFTGTEQYHRIGLFSQTNLTDGVIYVMQNGYSWFITDMLSVVYCEPKIKEQEFLCFKLKIDLEKKTARATITDGDDNILYKQDYEYTNAQIELNLFLTNGVLLLDNEY